MSDRHWNGNVQELANLLADHLVGEFVNGAFVGQEEGIEPDSNIGSWLKYNLWWAWNDAAGKYLPFPLIAGNLVKNVVRYTQLVSNAATTGVVLFLPDQNGATLATLDDIGNASGINATETLSGSTVTLDLSSKTRFWVNLSGNTTINRTGDLKDGQIVDIYFQTEPSTGPHTLTWNSADFYGVAGSGLSAADGSHYSVTRARAHVVGNAVYVEYEETFDVPVTQDVTGPQMISVKSNAGENSITVTFNELVKSSTLSASSWRVTKNGNNNTVTAAVASGSKVVLTLASNYQDKDTGTVTYLGTDLKDVSGNNAPVFGSSDLVIVIPSSSTAIDPSTTNIFIPI